MLATGLLGSARKGGISPAPAPSNRSPLSMASSLGLAFDPYDPTPLPSRILSTGAAANFPSVANLVGDVFNAPVFVPSTQVDSAQVVPHRNAPAQGFPSRAALGGSYIARWLWGREGGVGGLSVFEDEMKRLLVKRWVGTSGTPLRTHVNGPVSSAGGGPESGANSGASTPYGHPGSGRSGLGATVFVEEDEDEELEREKRLNERVFGLGLGPGLGVMGGIYGGGGGGGGGGSGAFGEIGFGPSRMRTQTGSTSESALSSGLATSTAFTTPDLNLGVLSPTLGTNGNAASSTPTAPTPLTPVVALATADAEAQIGLAKVAEADVDSFMTYAAIVPEYCRLEGILIKGMV